MKEPSTLLEAVRYFLNPDAYVNLCVQFARRVWHQYIQTSQKDVLRIATEGTT